MFDFKKKTLDPVVKDFIDKIDTVLTFKDIRDRIETLSAVKEVVTEKLNKITDSEASKGLRDGASLMLAGIVMGAIGISTLAIPALAAAGAVSYLIGAAIALKKIGNKQRASADRQTLTGQIDCEIVHLIGTSPQQGVRFLQALKAPFNASASPEQEKKFAALRLRVAPAPVLKP